MLSAAGISLMPFVIPSQPGAAGQLLALISCDFDLALRMPVFRTQTYLRSGEF